MKISKKFNNNSIIKQSTHFIKNALQLNPANKNGKLFYNKEKG